LDKPLTKKIVATAGVRTPDYLVFSTAEQACALAPVPVRGPVFLKPAWEGSSKGIRMSSRVQDPATMSEPVLALLKSYRQPVMAEEFIPGEEITVGMVGNPPEIVGIMRVVPRKPDPYFVYSLEVKRDWERLVEYECPAQLPPKVLDAISESSLRAFAVLGCRDLARMDFRVTPEGVPYFLEVNPLPGLSPRSGDLPIMARLMGWSYEGLLNSILRAAQSRYG